VLLTLQNGLLSGTAPGATNGDIVEVFVDAPTSGSPTTTTFVQNGAFSVQLEPPFTGVAIRARVRYDSNCDGSINQLDATGPVSEPFGGAVDPANRPKAFSPNGDGINDFLVFGGSDFDPTGTAFLNAYPNARITIFNRWGQEVFTARPYRNDWDGNKLPDGTYYYVLELGVDGQQPIKDYFSIVR
jgi:gliding motility-associated-like protein